MLSSRERPRIQTLMQNGPTIWERRSSVHWQLPGSHVAWNQPSHSADSQLQLLSVCRPPAGFVRPAFAASRGPHFHHKTAQRQRTTERGSCVCVCVVLPVGGGGGRRITICWVWFLPPKCCCKTAPRNWGSSGRDSLLQRHPTCRPLHKNL